MEEIYQAHEDDDVLEDTFSISVGKDQWAEVNEQVRYYAAMGWAFYFIRQTDERIVIYFQRQREE